jgi:hypothetical protein
MNSKPLEPETKREVYDYLREKGFSYLTIKILLGYNPDGIDRLTILLGKGTEYEYKLLNDDDFRKHELKQYLFESSSNNS